MQFRRAFVTVFFIAMALKGVSQLDLTKIIPPSPTTREFEKYINYEVSLHSGVPEISVPLYNIKVGAISIPISLSYHASGIKFKQTNGDVGVGWTLNPGYRVSRTMYGRKDEEFDMPATIQNPDTFTNKADRDTYLARFGKDPNDGSIPHPSGSLLDGEYDMFNYSLLTSNGSFIIRDRQNKTVAMLDASVDKVTDYAISNDLYSSPGFEFFDLSDGNGYRYRMGKNSSGNLDGVESKASYRTAWLVRNIFNPHNDSISFNYDLRLEEDFPSNHTVSLQEGEGPFINYPCLEAGYFTGQYSQSLYKVPFLKEIVTENETITFFRPIQNTTTGPFDNRITAMEVRNKSGELIRKIALTYSHNQYGAADPYDYVLLKKVSILSKQTSDTVEVYQFDYNGGEANNNYVHTHDYWGYIYWHNFSSEYGLPAEVGTENIKYIPDPNWECTLWPTTFNQITRKFSGEFEIPKYQTKTIVNDPVTYTLSKIVWPTGGYTTYEYESNQYYNQSGVAEKGAGLRLKKISSYDPVLDPIFPVLSKQYLYGDNNNGIGVARLRPDPRRFGNEQLSFRQAPSNDNIYILNRTIALSEMPATEAYADAMSSGGVHYTEVNVIHSNQATQNGREKYVYESVWGNNYYFFINNASSMYIGQYPGGLRMYGRIMYPQFIKTHIPYVKSPNLLKKEVYDKENNILLKEEFYYNTSPVETFEGLKVRTFVTNQESTTHNLYTIFNLKSYYDYDNYSIQSGKNMLTEKIVTQYVSNVPALNVKQQFTYNQYGQLKSEIISDSRADSIVTENTYPLDYASLTASDNITAGLKKLQDMNVVNPLVEKRVYKKDVAGNKKLISSTFNIFHTTSPVPAKILFVEIASPLTDFSPSSVTNGTLEFDSRYKPRIEFDLYDSKGNLLQQHKTNDVDNAYIWGYNNTYPIAEVINAKSKDIFYTSFEDTEGNSSDGESRTGKKSRTGGYTKSLSSLTNGNYHLTWWQKSGSTWNLQQSIITVNNAAYTINLSGQVDEVRFYPIVAQMTTYTYEPLIGVTSQCNAGNHITFYEYDAFNRLKRIRDQDNNIIKTFDYKYQQQQ